mgnify:CR=1 FL=1|jgi:hypothetical protein
MMSASQPRINNNSKKSEIKFIRNVVAPKQQMVPQKSYSTSNIVNIPNSFMIQDNNNLSLSINLTLTSPSKSI